MTSTLYRSFIVTSIALLLASCTPIVDTRGHSADAIDTSQIIKGQSSPEDISALLGSPTTSSTFGDMIWYYVTQKQERVGIFAPEVTEQHVVAITFDADKKVSDIREYSKEQGKFVEMVDKTTPSEGHSMTVIEQMLGNLGRFNSPGRGMSQRNMGR